MGKTMTQKVKTLKQRFALIENELKIAKQQLEHILPVDAVVINFLPDAVKIVTKAIREDKDLYIAYQANIAMPFQDEFKRQMGQIGRNEAIENIHQIANNAAKYFLDLWCKE